MMNYWECVAIFICMEFIDDLWNMHLLIGTYLWNKIIGQIVSKMNFFCQNKIRNINFSHIFFFRNFLQAIFVQKIYLLRKICYDDFLSKNITMLAVIKNRECVKKLCGFLIYVIFCNSIVSTRSNNFNY